MDDRNRPEQDASEGAAAEVALLTKAAKQMARDIEEREMWHPVDGRRDRTLRQLWEVEQEMVERAQPVHSFEGIRMAGNFRAGGEWKFEDDRPLDLHDLQGPTPPDPDADKDFEALARILNRIQENHGVTLQPRWVNTHTFQPDEEDDPGQPQFTTELPLLHDSNFVRGIEGIATARGLLMGWHGWNREPDPEGRMSVNDRVVELLTKALEDLQR